MKTLTDAELADLAMKFAQIADGVLPGDPVVYVREAKMFVSALTELKELRALAVEMHQATTKVIDILNDLESED